MKNHTACFVLAFVIFSAFVNVTPAQSQDWEIISTSDFYEIYMEGPVELILAQGPSCKVQLQYDGPSRDKVNIYSAKGRLNILHDGSTRWRKETIKVRVTVSDLELLHIQGAVSIKTDGALFVDNLKIAFDGVGTTNLNLDARKIISEINGVGSFYLAGKTDYHKVNFSGVGKYDAIELESKFTSVDSDGIGTVKVHAGEKFIGNASGIGTVEYAGNPQDVRVDATGIGKVRRH
ncbi:MAG: DUF2807 domain-containing protein [Cyclobacteriaceae bacterium]|nr:DUF2807 domain-containing protein [Cyclobacteriaceae bacterium]